MKNAEIRDLLISWLTISIAFTWLIHFYLSPYFSFPNNFVNAFIVSAIGTGTGFIMHEMAHKIVAQHFGARAEFRMWNFGLIFALISAFVFKIIFAAPGAVYISGHLTRRQNGLVSIAGPLINFVAGICFLLLSFIISDTTIGFIVGYGAIINLWLGLFNMLPIGPLDGKKIFVWNPKIWAVLFVALLFFVFAF